MKIAEAVRIVMVVDPDVQIADDDIVFESLSDNTLQLLHQYMFPKADVVIDDDDDDDCVMTMVPEPSMNLYIDKWSTKFFGNNNTTMVEDLTKIAPLKRIPNFGTTKKMVFSVYQRADGNFAIQLPQENASQRDTIIISKDLWSKLCLSLWASFGNKVISNKLY